MKMDFHLEDQRHKKRFFMKIVFVDLSDLEQKIHETTRSWISGDAPLVKMAAIRKSFLADKIVGYGHPLRMGSQTASLPTREMCARSFFRAASDPADLESKIKKDVESFFSTCPDGHAVLISGADMQAVAERAMLTGQIVEQVIPWSDEGGPGSKHASCAFNAITARATIFDYCSWADLSQGIKTISMSTASVAETIKDGEVTYEKLNIFGLPALRRTKTPDCFVGDDNVMEIEILHHHSAVDYMAALKRPW